MKDSTRFTVEVNGTDVLEVWKDGGQVRIDLGEGATERLILGDAFRTFLNNFFSTIFDLHTHLAGTMTTPSGAVTGVSGAPIPAFTGTQMQTSLLSDLAKTKQT